MKKYFRYLFRMLGIMMGLIALVGAFTQGLTAETGLTLIGAAIFILMCEMVADGI